MLKQAGIKTVIICGNSFQGATVGTSQEAVQRGYKVIVPVDCSAGESVYHEQYAAFQLAKGGPGRHHRERDADAHDDGEVLRVLVIASASEAIQRSMRAAPWIASALRASQ